MFWAGRWAACSGWTDCRHAQPCMLAVGEAVSQVLCLVSLWCSAGAGAGVVCIKQELMPFTAQSASDSVRLYCTLNPKPCTLKSKP